MSSDFLANVTPANDRPIPVGTLAELEQQNMDPAAYASCARPNKLANVLGCPFFDKCRVSAKGKAGPKNYGVQIVKGRRQGGAFVNTEVDCMWISERAEHYEANGGSIRVIAEEGETFEKVTGVSINNETNKVTNQWDRNARREVRRVPVTVKPYPRPTDNPMLIQDVMRAEIAQQDKERRSDENLARSLGNEGAIPPLDRRGDGRGKKEGGAKP